MSRDSGAHGVQVVGGSNPPCPTKNKPQEATTTYAFRSERAPLNARPCVVTLRHFTPAVPSRARSYRRRYQGRMDHENLISRIEIAAELGVQSQSIRFR
jgi:hypothetical protein